VTDRYSKIVLTVIAAALVYLCVVMTAFPSVQAQTTRRAGEIINTPIEAVIVGWKADGAIPIASREPLRVQTERASGVADRVVVVGWEEGATRERPNAVVPIMSSKGQNLPVTR
jgi:hypothetical protein